MSFSSTIKTILDLDISKFKSGARAATEAAANTIGHGLGHAVDRKLGLRDAMKNFVAGVGLDITSVAQQVARIFTGMSDQAEENLKRISEASAKATEAIDAQIKARRTPTENISRLQQEDKRLASEESELAKKTRLSPFQAGLLRIQKSYFPKDYEAQMTRNNFLPEDKEARPAEIKARRQEIAKELQELQASERESSREINRAREEGLTAALATEKQIAALREKAVKLEATAAMDRRLTGAERVAMEKEAAGLRLQADKMGEELFKKMVENEERARSLRAAAEHDALSAEDKIAATTREIDNLKAQLLQKDLSIEQRGQLRIQIAEKERQLTGEINDRISKQIQLREAVENVSVQSRDLAEAKANRFTPGLDDIASGKRGSASDRARAREIARLEGRAQRAYDTGSEFRDSMGQRVSAGDYASQLMSRADQLRQGFSRTRENDRNPFRASEEALRKSERHLADIKKGLEPTSL